jgi:hypothetical protein
MEIQQVFEDGAQRGVSKRHTSIDTHVLRPKPLITPEGSQECLDTEPSTLESYDLLPNPKPSIQFDLFPVADLSIPQRANPAPPSSIQHFQYPQAQQIFDTAGQVAPPGVNVDQVMSNEHARSMPTTPATTPPGSFAQLVPPDSERIINARVISERGLASSPIAFPAPPLTTCDPSQSWHPSVQNSPRMTTTYTVHGLSNFPVLGLRSIRDRVNSPSPNRLSPPLQSHPQGPSPTSATLSRKLSPTASDMSSFDWTEDGQDPALLQLISISCSVLLHAYLKLARKTVPSESEQQDVDGPKQTKDRVGRQQSSQSTTNNHKRKQNSSRDKSDDGNDQADTKRQRSDSKGPAGSDVRPLACPFNKYDNRLFGPESPDDAYRVCATCSFVSIAHLKWGFNSIRNDVN